MRESPFRLMTAIDLVSLASEAYGAGWQSKLARDLGVSHPTVWRWAHGRHRISKAMGMAITAACATQILGNTPLSVTAAARSG